MRWRPWAAMRSSGRGTSRTTSSTDDAAILALRRPDRPCACAGRTGAPSSPTRARAQEPWRRRQEPAGDRDRGFEDARRLRRDPQRALGYRQVFRYQKYRRDLRAGARSEIVLDETPIGTFLEIEGPVGDDPRGRARPRPRPADYIAGLLRGASSARRAAVGTWCSGEGHDPGRRPRHAHAARSRSVAPSPSCPSSTGRSCTGRSRCLAAHGVNGRDDQPPPPPAHGAAPPWATARSSACSVAYSFERDDPGHGRRAAQGPALASATSRSCSLNGDVVFDFDLDRGCAAATSARARPATLALHPEPRSAPLQSVITGPDGRVTRRGPASRRARGTVSLFYGRAHPRPALLDARCRRAFGHRARALYAPLIAEGRPPLGVRCEARGTISAAPRCTSPHSQSLLRVAVPGNPARVGHPPRGRVHPRRAWSARWWARGRSSQRRRGAGSVLWDRVRGGPGRRGGRSERSWRRGVEVEDGEALRSALLMRASRWRSCGRELGAARREPLDAAAPRTSRPSVRRRAGGAGRSRVSEILADQRVSDFVADATARAADLRVIRSPGDASTRPLLPPRSTSDERSVVSLSTPEPFDPEHLPFVVIRQPDGGLGPARARDPRRGRRSAGSSCVKRTRATSPLQEALSGSEPGAARGAAIARPWTSSWCCSARPARGAAARDLLPDRLRHREAVRGSCTTSGSISSRATRVRPVAWRTASTLAKASTRLCAEIASWPRVLCPPRLPQPQPDVARRRRLYWIDFQDARMGPAHLRPRLAPARLLRGALDEDFVAELAEEFRAARGPRRSRATRSSGASS